MDTGRRSPICPSTLSSLLWLHCWMMLVNLFQRRTMLTLFNNRTRKLVMMHVTSRCMLRHDVRRNNCNVSCRPKIDFFSIKVDKSDVNPGICKQFSYRQIPGLTSLPSSLTAKTSMKMKCSADKIYYNFFQENSKITNM